MKRVVVIIYLSFSIHVLLYAQRSQQLFDSSWKFTKQDIPDGESISIRDASWRTVQLPHDWSIEDLPAQSDSVIGPFSKNSTGMTATGYTVGGTAWYRKHFTLGKGTGKKVSIYFDGVYMNSDVWINGHHLGNHPYGYTPFYYELTSYLKHNGEDNIIAVRVRNEGKTSRWYSGSGIYRHVWLITTERAYVKPWGVYVTTPSVTGSIAVVDIKTSVVNEENISRLKLVTTIRDTDKKIIATTSSFLNSDNEINQSVTIKTPKLWLPESPFLYEAVTEIMQGNKAIERVETSFGIRSIDISAAKGFLLNGKNIKLRGGCIHNDNGLLGSATIDRAEERKVELLKKNGFNAVRTSHNPPSQQFLDACDRIGIIVIDEAFDMWQRAKNPQDYHLYFDTCWKKDLAAMILRDRNHPSVVFWSMGNEINERVDSEGLEIEKRLAAEIKRLDNTRYITEAICTFWDHPGYNWDTTAAAFAMMDVGSYNYSWKQYEPDHEKHSERVMMGTESYPKQALINWNLVEKHPYVIGDFVWTAMDYLGETGLGHTRLDTGGRRFGLLQTFPWFNAWCGDIDLIGDKKPQLYYRDVVWGTSPMHMLVHNPIPEGRREIVSDWGWPDEVPSYHFPGSEGKPLQVNVYTRYPNVRLELNGKIIGQKEVLPDNLTASFEINYQPGILKSVALDNNGNKVDSVILQTAGKPSQIRLIADRRQIKASSNDLAYVTVEIIDADGRLVPDAVIPLRFSLDGTGEIVATGSAEPNDMQSFQQPVHKTFRGKCLVILRSKGKTGKIILKAGGNGLSEGKVSIEIIK